MKTYNVSVPGLEAESSGANAGSLLLDRKDLKAIFVECQRQIRSFLEALPTKATQSQININKVAVVGGVT